MGNNGSDEILFEGDILMEESTIDDYLNSGSLRQKRGAGRERRSINIWQPNKIAYVLDSSLGSKSACTKKKRERLCSISCYAITRRTLCKQFDSNLPFKSALISNFN